MSRFDVVVFGASGFTGQHAAQQLATLAKQRSLTWAVAGRSRDKLLRILKDISDKTGLDVSSTPVLVADVTDEPSLQEMCRQARVLASCCGPYTLLGENVVKTCIDSGTHYVDVTAEANFIELMQLKYGRAARDAGVYVVSACGFESIPADLGVLYLQQNFDGVLNSVEVYSAPDMPGGSVNFGTWHSMIHILAHFWDVFAIRKKLYPKPLPKLTPKLRYRLPLHRRLGGWCTPFPCTDSAIVHRTQRFFFERDGTRPAQINTYIKLGSLATALAIIMTIAFIFIMSQFSITRKILLKNPRWFSLGLIDIAPDEKVIENVGFQFVFFGQGWDNKDAAKVHILRPKKKMVAKISGTNPGYGMTVLALLFSALAILEEQNLMPPGGGVITPGIAFAKTSLVKNLHDHGVTFEITRGKVHHD